MTPAEMEDAARRAIRAGTGMTLVKPKGRMPAGFPRGELLCENTANERVYRFDPHKVLAWLTKNGLA